MTAVLTPDAPLKSSAPSITESPADTGDKAGLVWLAVLWTVCAYPFSVNVVDPDLWGHVQYAHDWLSEGALPRVSSHNFTAEGHRWINHENLSELFLAIGFDQLGNVGMSVLKFASGMGLLLLAWLGVRRHGVSASVYLGIAILVAYALHPFWLFRPQMATWLGLAAMVWLLNQAFANWHQPGRAVRWGYLIALGPLFVVWTNAHGGFLAGLCMLAAYLFGRCTELFLQKNPRALAVSLQLALVGIGVAAMTLLNPYGIGLHRWLIQSLGEARPEITEWHRPTLLSPVFAPFFALVLLSLLAWVASERKRDWTHGLVLLVTMAQALLHIRHIALFAILALFWMPLHIHSLHRICFQSEQIKIRKWISSKPVRYACLAVIFVAASITGRRLMTLPVLSHRYPVQAIQFMHDNHVNGRLVVSFNWAQYAIAALQPNTQVSFDGRFRTCYPQHIIDKHFDFIVGDDPEMRNRASNEAFDATAILREGDPEIVLLDRQFPHSLKVVREQADEFTLLYEDSVAQLWGKRSRFADADPIQGDYPVHGADRFPNAEWPAYPTPQSN